MIYFILSTLKIMLYLLLIIITSVGSGSLLTKKINGITYFEKFSLSAGIGFIFISLFVFMLSALHLLYMKLLIILLILSVIIFIQPFSKLLKMLFSEIKSLKKELSPVSYFFIIGIILLLIIPFILALMPQTSWDAMVYHLQTPKVYLQNHGFVSMQYDLYANMPMNVQMIYMLGMSLGDDRLPALIHFTMAILLLLAIFGFAKRMYSTKSAILSVMLFLLSPSILSQLGFAYVDIAMAYFFFLFFILIYEYFYAGNKNTLILCGLLAGYIAGIKLTSGTFIAGIILLIFIKNIFVKKINFVCLIKDMFFISAIGLIIFSPWMIKSLYYTANPLYPMLYKYYGGMNLDANIVNQLTAWHLNIGMGRDAIHTITALWNVFFMSAESYSNFAGKVSPAILIFTLFAVISKPFKRERFDLFILTIALFYLWFLGSQQIRFLFPILTLFCVIGGSLFYNIENKFGKNNLNSEIIVLLITLPFVLIAFNYMTAYANVLVSKEYIFGKETKSQYLEKRFPLYDFFKKVEKITSESDKFIIVMENRGYYFDRKYYSDSSYEGPFFYNMAYDSKTNNQLKIKFQSIGVDYIICNLSHRESMNRDVQDNKIFTDENFKNIFLDGSKIVDDFLNKDCELLIKENDFALYKIKS